MVQDSKSSDNIVEINILWRSYFLFWDLHILQSIFFSTKMAYIEMGYVLCFNVLGNLDWLCINIYLLWFLLETNQKEKGSRQISQSAEIPDSNIISKTNTVFCGTNRFSSNVHFNDKLCTTDYKISVSATHYWTKSEKISICNPSLNVEWVAFFVVPKKFKMRETISVNQSK